MTTQEQHHTQALTAITDHLSTHWPNSLRILSTTTFTPPLGPQFTILVIEEIIEPEDLGDQPTDDQLNPQLYDLLITIFGEDHSPDYHRATYEQGPEISNTLTLITFG